VHYHSIITNTAQRNATHRTDRMNSIDMNSLHRMAKEEEQEINEETWDGKGEPPHGNSFTDLAHQEIENWIDGEPKVSEQAQDESEIETQPDTTEDEDLEPSEMDIVVPETKEEEEKIDEEIEEWEEKHGKGDQLKPNHTNGQIVTQDAEHSEDSEPEEMYIPQTEIEEEEINEKIEKWEEEHGKGEPPQTLLHHTSSDITFPTMSPVKKAPTTPTEPPLLPLVHLYPPTDASFTDLAHQEIENWIGGGPKNSEDSGPPDETNVTTPDDDEEAIEKVKKEVDEEVPPDGMVPPPDDEEEEIDEEIDEFKKEIDEKIEEWEQDPENDTPESNHLTKKKKKPKPKNNDDEAETTTEPMAPATANPLVVSPSWTPPKVKPKHELATANPTIAPVGSFAMPTDTITTQEDLLEACHEFDANTVAQFSCEMGIPAIAAYGVLAFLPLLIIGCCWKYCCGRSKTNNSDKGEYRAVNNIYGDASYDNAFSEDFSDDDVGADDDLEDATWGGSNGRRVLEMSDLGRRKGDGDLSLNEMNG